MNTSKYAEYISKTSFNEKKEEALPTPNQVLKMNKDQRIEAFKKFMHAGYSSHQALKMSKL